MENKCIHIRNKLFLQVNKIRTLGKQVSIHKERRKSLFTVVG